MNKSGPDIQLWLTRHGPRITWLCFVSIGFLFGLFLLTFPIRNADTDLWYHLAGGRYLLEYGALANPLNISFIEPSREFINYYWGFQALTFVTWSVAGYIGLIVMKAIVLLAAAWFLTKVLIADIRFSSVSWLQIIFVAVIVFQLSLRGLTVRPHIFSYLFIPLFIYILMYREKWFPALPLIAVIWVNIHGVEWIIGALIGGSHVFERLVQFNQHRDIRQLVPCTWVLACIPAMMVNPNGVYILTAPFIAPPDIYDFITELAPINLLDYMNQTASWLENNAFLFLILFFAVAFFFAARDYKKHVFALLLAAGGVLLLFRGGRFIWEWLLLSSPLFSVGLQALWHGRPIESKRPLVLLLVPILLSSTWWQVNNRANSQYPFDEDSLPRGTSDFILNLNLSGKYAVVPDLAGYVEWRLGEQNIRIFSDMQFPPFSDYEFFEIIQSMHSTTGHRHMIEKYAPDLIGVEIENDRFPDIVSDQFVPVFFDQVLVLYLNRDTYPDVAAQYELKHINPFEPNKLRADQVTAGVEELKRMLEVTEHIPDTKISLIGFLIESGDLDEARRYLDSINTVIPRIDRVEYFQAKIAHQEGNYALAIEHYDRALMANSGREHIMQLMAECHFQSGDPGQAYELFEASINPYRYIDVSLLHYYLYAFSSYLVGDRSRSERLIEMFRYLDDGGDPSLTRQIDELELLQDGQG